MAEVLSSPLLGILLCMGAYIAARSIQNRWRHPLLNPLLLSTLLIIGFLVATGIPYEDFDRGGSIVSMFLPPATAALALSIYRQRAFLRQAFLPALAGCFVGSLVSLISVKVLCTLFGMDDILTVSMLPKSVTGAIAMDLAQSMGGVPAITAVCTLITGIAGSVFSPLFIRILRIKSPVAAGIGIGSSSHALGTSKALELGELQGAMSGIAIGLSGLITVVLCPLFFP